MEMGYLDFILLLFLPSVVGAIKDRLPGRRFSLANRGRRSSPADTAGASTPQQPALRRSGTGSGTNLWHRAAENASANSMRGILTRALSAGRMAPSRLAPTSPPVEGDPKRRSLYARREAAAAAECVRGSAQGEAPDGHGSAAGASDDKAPADGQQGSSSRSALLEDTRVASLFEGTDDTPPPTPLPGLAFSESQEGERPSSPFSSPRKSPRKSSIVVASSSAELPGGLAAGLSPRQSSPHAVREGPRPSSR